MYNDEPENVQKFFHSIGRDFGKYKNPADELLKLANQKENGKSDFANGKINGTVYNFDDDNERKLPPQESSISKSNIIVTSSTSIRSMFINNYGYRKANFFKQLYYLIKRNFIGAVRNPRGMGAVLFISFFQSAVMCSIFLGVGEKRLIDVQAEIDKIPKVRIFMRKEKALEMITLNLQTIKDYAGFIFFCATDQFLSITFGQIL